MRALLFMLQSVGATELAGVDFDLKTMPATPVGRNEIVVTARRRSQRLEPLPDIPPDTVPRAETGLVGNLRGGVDIEQQNFGNGMTSNRVMVKLKLPF